MFRKLIQTNDDPILAVLRFALGVVFFAHGAQKALGWFGGAGYNGTMGFFTQNLGIPAVFAVLAILAEFLGGIGLLLGFLTRIAAFAIAVDMLVAVALVHASNGFFMNWLGNQRGEGYEFHILAIAMALFIIVHGAGALSLDRAFELSERHRPTPHPEPMRGY
ncbi:MAG TPA: DoxX family protein [Bryobacteraceae bacterium]|nr:DoxX family protein [Bryobacteraceae bacterium]